MEYKIKQIPIYNGQVALCITDDPQELYEIFSEKSLENTEIMNRGVLYAHTLWLDYKGRSCYTIVLNFNKSKHGHITHNAIAHEAFHVMNMLFEGRGVEYTQRHDEHAAYMLGWIVDFVYDQLDKMNLLDKVKLKD